jgi:hypothetical protein
MNGTAAELDDSNAYIMQTFGVPALTMAAPYGNPSWKPLAMTRYLANRGTGSGIVAPNGNTDPFDLPCYIPLTNAAAGAFDSEITAARNAGGWKIVLVHGFSGGSDGAYQPVSIAEFVTHVNRTKGLGDMWIGTLVDVVAYWQAQKLISGLTPTTSGSTTTWTWTLPSKFPPGKFLRVKVTGGTLSQGGTPLVWDDHGYYEVALDRGSLTLAP